MNPYPGAGWIQIIRKSNAVAENRISLGVSSCLLGHKVRYDGDDKLNAIIEKDICTQFHCIPLCPEYAVGLGVPRNPVQLVQTNDSIHVLSVSDRSLNITALLQQYADFPENLPRVEILHDVTFTIRSLASAFTGFRRVRWLANWGMVEGEDDAIGRADVLFATRYAPSCPDNF